MIEACYRYIFKIFPLLFLFSGVSISAQELIPSIQKYGVEDGLSHREVNSLYQDKTGIIWVGTRQGLNRFDGYDFSLFSKEKDGLSSNYISTIVGDSKGLLWLFQQYPNPSIDIFDPLEQKVIPFEEKFPDFDLFKFDEIDGRGFLPGADGHFFLRLIDRKTVIHYHADTGFKVIPLPDDLPPIKRFIISPDNIVWLLLATHQLVAFDLAGNQVHENDLESLFYARETGMNGFFVYQGPYENLKKKAFFIDWSNHVYPIPEENWDMPNAGYPSKAFVVNLVKEQLLNEFPRSLGVTDHFLDKFVDPYGQFGFESIRTYMADRSGRVWIGSSFGLLAVSLSPNKFDRKLYIEDFNLTNNYTCRGILRHGDYLLVNTDNRGLQVINNSTNVVGDFEPKDFLRYGIFKDRSGQIFTGGMQGGLKLLDSTFQTSWVSDSVEVWAFQQISSSRVLMGCEYGLAWLNTQDLWVQPFLDYGQFPQLRFARIIHLAQDAADNTWICSNIGLFRMDRTGAIVEKFGLDQTDDNFLPLENVQHLYIDGEGIIWLATSGNGLVRWDYNKREYRQFTRNQGLSNNNIYAVYEDNHQYLWMSSDFGLNRMDKKTYKILSFQEADGICHNEFNRISHYQGIDGTLYFGGLNGLTIFHPDDFFSQDSTLDAPLIISSVWQYDAPEQQLRSKYKALQQTNKLVIRPNDQMITLEVALLSYENIDKVEYAWKIEDVDRDWIYQKDRKIRLDRVPYGNYKLRIKGQSASGQWSRNELELELEVLRPFYLQFFFLLIIGLGVLFLALGAYRYRIYSLKKSKRVLQQEINLATVKILEDKKVIEGQAEQLRHLDKVKSDFYANVSHELRTPLTLIMGPIQSVISAKKVDDSTRQLLALALRQGRHLLGLINELLDLSKLDAGRMGLSPQTFELHHFLQQQITLFENIAEKKGIQLNMDYDLESPFYLILDQKKLEKILNNLLGNALKFTQQFGQVNLLVRKFEERIYFQVSDNGRGIPATDLAHVFDRYYQVKTKGVSEGGTGIGLALCKEFVNMMGGRIEVESVLGKGSSFSVEIPYQAVPKQELDRFIGEEKEKESQKGDYGQVPIATSSIQASKTKILVVEDHPELQSYLHYILDPLGEVTIAENGIQALEKLKNNSFSLILSDIMMPEMDGFQLLEFLKGSDEYRHIPVVMLTAKADTADRLKALRIGVDDYLLKPFYEAELVARVENLLANVNQKQVPGDAESESSAPQILRYEQEWLINLESTIQDKLGDFNLTAEVLASSMAMSRARFFREIKRLTGLTPNQYLMEARFQKARKLLELGEVSSVKAASYEVGFKQVKYFSQQFKKRFGRLPSEYL